MQPHCITPANHPAYRTCTLPLLDRTPIFVDRAQIIHPAQNGESAEYGQKRGYSQKTSGLAFDVVCIEPPPVTLYAFPTSALSLSLSAVSAPSAVNHPALRPAFQPGSERIELSAAFFS